MALSHEPGVRRSYVPAWLLVVAGGLAVVVALMLVTDGRDEGPSTSSRRGSGVSATDLRDVVPFTGVELAGSNTVAIHVGEPQSVAVVGDDNLVGRVTTVVRDGSLVIDDTGSFTTRAPMRVAVAVPSIDGVVLGGAGTVTIDGVASADFNAELAGEGTLAVAGTAERVAAVLTGTGTLDLHDLAASAGTAQLQGTGTIRIHVTTTLEATLTGTGSILYRGEPTVTMHDTGTGTVAAE
jgi:hypothetical protein